MSNNIEEQREIEDKKKNSSSMEKINDFLLNFQRVSTKDILFFLEHLKVMVKSGISLSRSLNTLSLQAKNKKFCKILVEVARNVDQGESFADSLRPHKKIFNNLFINMIEAGEVSGGLENILDRLYIQFKKSNELKSKIKGALTYPTVIMIAMLGIGTFMMIFVVPKITSMFQEFNATLPLPTRILIAVSDFLAHNILLALIIFIIVVVVLVKALKTKKGKHLFEFFLLKSPIFGAIAKQINLARFSRTLSSLLKTDIMIIDSFNISSEVVSNTYYQRALKDIGDRVKKGEKIGDAMEKYPNLFPPVTVQMTKVGEETGELDSILEEVAEFYEMEIDQVMENLPSIIEPLIILFLGVVIGGIAIAIITPMYSLTTVV